MNFTVIPFLCLLLMTDACNDNPVATNNTITQVSNPKIEMEKKNYPFDTNMQLKQMDKSNNYQFLVTMLLDKGTFFGSPNSKNDFKGLWNVSFENTSFLKISDALIESPNSVESYDPLSKQMVNWVKEETTYTKEIVVNGKDDFTVNGIVSFVVEPICNRYEVAFSISNKDGNLSILKQEPIIANLP